MTISMIKNRDWALRASVHGLVSREREALVYFERATTPYDG